MPTFRRSSGHGNSFAGPINTRRPFGVSGTSGRDAAVGFNRPFTNDQQFEDQAVLWGPRSRCDIFDDFVLGAHVFGATSGAVTSLSPFTTVLTTTAGAPTVAVTANAANGIIQALLANSNEVEVAGINWADNLAVPMNRDWIFSCSVRVPVAATSVQDFIFGLSTAYNATLASTTKYVWFRLGNAASPPTSMLLKAEAKDGTTTTLAAASALPDFTFPTNTFTMLTILYRGQLERNSGFAEFWVEDNFLGKVNIAAGAVTDMLQPVILVRKASGTTTPAIDIDWARCSWNRF